MSAPSGDRVELELPSRLELLVVMDKIAESLAEVMAFDDVDRDAVAISLVEAVTNAIQHGHHADPSKRVKVSFELRPDELIMTVSDQGTGYEPEETADTAPPDLLATRGRGLFLMRSTMDEVSYDNSNGTTVRLVKRRSPAAEGGEDA